MGSRHRSCSPHLGVRWTLLAAVILACAAGAPTASAAGTTAPRAVAHAARIGAAPTGQQLRLVLPLKVDAAGLARFATEVSTPGSPFYGRYLSVAALARRFGASSSARTRVVRFLRARGATAVRVDATGLLAQATVSVGLAERMFAAPLARFRSAAARFVAPVRPSTVPVALRTLVDGVVGLDTEPQTSPSLPSLVTAGTRPSLAGASTGAAAAQTSSALPRSGTPAGCVAGQNAGQQDGSPGFTPNQYLAAYGFLPLQLQNYLGQGERVALIEIDGFHHSDLRTFARCFGLPVPRVTGFGVGVSRQLPSTGEATLDLEVLAAAAPGLKAVDVYETTPDAAHTLAAFAAPLQNRGRKPQVMSASIGLCETEAFVSSGLIGIEATERVLEAAAAVGVSVLAASGDNGSSDCQSKSGRTIDVLGINYPASSRWATSVGGTNLMLTASNQIAAQPVWNDTTVAPVAGGGGASEIFSRPTYQDGVVATNRRQVPDVSMLADLLPGYSIYCTATPACLTAKNKNPWLTVGGTSAATPLLAGGVAIVDGILRASHRENLGLLNPLIYELGGSSAAPTVFDDVTTGGNDIGPYILGGAGVPLGCCTATAGYDDASGWGSVNITGFAGQALQLVPKLIEFSVALPGHQRPVAHRELLADVSCSDACSIGALATVKAGRSKLFTVTSQVFQRLAQGSQTIPIKFTKKELRSLRRALAHHRKVVATVHGVLIDTLGAIEHETRGKRLRIR